MVNQMATGGQPHDTRCRLRAVYTMYTEWKQAIPEIYFDIFLFASILGRAQPRLAALRY